MIQHYRKEISAGLPKRGAILVTGGAGLIGSALIAGLNELDFERIYVTDFLGEDSRYRNLIGLRFLDFFHPDQLDSIIADGSNLLDIRAVLHMGACSDTTEKDAEYLMLNNYRYTQELAIWATRNYIRFVYASSAATYGDGSRGMDDRASIDRLIPLNAYGYSKHAFDLFAQRSGLLDKLVGLKYFNVFGPGEHHKDAMRSMVAKAYDQICESGRVELFKSHRPDFANGEQRRDFLYVRDAVNMTLFLAFAKPKARGLYNIGGGKAHTWLELMHAIFAALDKAPVIDFVDMPKSLRAQYQYHTCAALQKLRSAGYEAPVFPLSEAIYEYIQDFLIPGKLWGSRD